MSFAFKAVIPARYASTRLPGKPLLPIAGQPMIAHVCARAAQAGAEEVVVATDDDRILRAVNGLGITAVMTREDHQSGTERIAEVADKLGWSSQDIIVNVQGDEPLIPPEYIKDLAHALASQQHAGIATLCAKIDQLDEVFNPNAVKVVLDKDGYALYFSRAPIPWDREGFAGQDKSLTTDMPFYRHIGLYAYRVDFLNRYTRWSPSLVEKTESLEQLRILWHGERIKVKVVPHAPPPGVDTPEDLARVNALMSGAAG